MYWAVPRPFTAVTTHNIERWWLKAEKKKKGENTVGILKPIPFKFPNSPYSTIPASGIVVGVSKEAKLYGKYKSIWLVCRYSTKFEKKKIKDTVYFFNYLKLMNSAMK